MMKEDRRVKRTKQLIQNAFIELLKKNDLSKITVTAIVNQANIGRSTFYLYYDNVEALFEQLASQTVYDFIEIVLNAYTTKRQMNYEELVTDILDYVIANVELLKVFVTDNERYLARLKEIVIRIMFRHEGITLKDPQAWLESSFAINAFIDTICQWILSQRRMKLDDLKEYLVTVLTKIFID